MQQKPLEPLTKFQSSERLQKLLSNRANEQCFQCKKKSKNWVEIKHGIFLCLTCASSYKQLSKSVEVKSIQLNTWTREQIQMLEIGGNLKFKQFLDTYHFNLSQPKIFLKSKAAQYYGRWLNAQVTNEEIEQKPSIQQGIKPHVYEIPLTEMTGDEMLTEAKQRLSWAGTRTKYYGNKVFDKVHHKITSGELKQDVKNAAGTVGKTVKDFWALLTSKNTVTQSQNLGDRRI